MLHIPTSKVKSTYQQFSKEINTFYKNFLFYMNEMAKPSAETILVDMDGTLFAFEGSFLPRIQKYYKYDRIEKFPMTENLVSKYSIIAGAISLSCCCYIPRYYLDELLMQHSIELINYLFDHCFAIFFLTAPWGVYHQRLCEFEKMAQI